MVIIVLCPHESLVEFAAGRWQNDPDARIEDAYKWLYQATRGGEHAVPDKHSARQWLQREWQSLGEPLPNEKIWEPLRPDGKIGRLNLRPFRAKGGKQEDLLAAFLESAKSFKGTHSEFQTAWADLGTQLKKQSIGKITWNEWKRLDGEMRAKNYPAVHHSREYNEARSPAYRVLTNSASEKLLRLVRRL